MLDITILRDSPDDIITMLHNRQQPEDEAKLRLLLEEDRERRRLVKESDELKSLRNRKSKEIAEIKKSGSGSTDALILEMQSVGTAIAEMDSRLTALEASMEDILLALPNRLHPSVPVGRSAEENEVFGEPVRFSHPLDFPLKTTLNWENLWASLILNAAQRSAVQDFLFIWAKEPALKGPSSTSCSTATPKSTATKRFFLPLWSTASH